MKTPTTDGARPSAGKVRSLVDLAEAAVEAERLEDLHHLLSDLLGSEAAARVQRRFTARLENGGPPEPSGTVLLADEEKERVRWLWPDRIPLGKLTLLDGDPGLLKSTLTLDLAARLSVGAPLPDGADPDVEGPAGTVLLTAEDGLADTVRPRLEAAGGNPARVAVVRNVTTEEGERRPPHIGDTSEIGHALRRVDARLLVLDPLMAFLPPDVNSHRDQSVRRALTPLTDLADAAGVAVVAIRHLNKSGGSNPKYRGGGSIGLIGAARSGLLVAEDPDAPNSRRVLAATKANLSESAPSLSYLAQEAENGAVRVKWLGKADHEADALLDRPSPEERTKVQEAADVLTEELSNGPRPVKDIYKAASDLGISKRTMRRAANRLDVEKDKDGYGSGPWRWSLPDSGADSLEEMDAGQKGGTVTRDLPSAQGSRLSGQGGGQNAVQKEAAGQKPDGEGGLSGHRSGQPPGQNENGPAPQGCSWDRAPFVDSESRDTGGNECAKCGEPVGPTAEVCGGCRRAS